MMLESSVLVYILWDSDRRISAIGNKLYEYIAAQKPILALVPEGDSRDLIKASGLGIFVAPTNIDEIVDKIYQLYKKWRNDSLIPDTNDKFIEQFALKKETVQLATIIDQISLNKANSNQKDK